MDAVNASVSRYKPWALVYPVKHTGYTVSYREKYDGASNPQNTRIAVRKCFKISTLVGMEHNQNVINDSAH